MHTSLRDKILKFAARTAGVKYVKSELARIIDYIPTTENGGLIVYNKKAVQPWSAKHEKYVLSKDGEYLTFRAFDACKIMLQPVIKRLKDDMKTEITDQEVDILHKTERLQDIICRYNTRLAVGVIKYHFKHYGPNAHIKNSTWKELELEAYYGLFKAVKYYNYNRGYRFSTYAYRVMLNAVRNLDNKNKLHDARYRPAYILKNNNSNSSNPRYTHISDTKVSKELPPDHKLINNDRRHALESALSYLSETERQVISLLYLSDDVVPYSYKRVCKDLEITYNRFKTVYRSAMRKLRHDEQLKNAAWF